MRRRDLLAALTAGTAGLAGCSLFGGGGDGDPTVTPYDVPSDERTPRDVPTTQEPPRSTPQDTPVRPLEWQHHTRPPATVSFETVPRTLAATPLQYGTRDRMVFALRIGGTATDEHPATVQTLLYNDNDFEKTVNLGRFPLFGRTVPVGTHSANSERAVGRGELFLVPTARHELVDEAFDALERGPDGYWHADIHPGDYPQGGTATVPARDGVVGEYAVTAGRGDGPLVTGTYRFSGADLAGTTGPTQPVAMTVWNTDSPGPTTDSQFDGLPTPFDRAPNTQWFHEADASTTRYLVPEREVLELPTRFRTFLVNRTRDWYTGEPTVYKQEGGRWYDLGPRFPVEYVDQTSGGEGVGASDVDLAAGVGPDGIADFEMAFAHEPADAGTGIQLGYLGGGHYAVVVELAELGRSYGALLDIRAPETVAKPQDRVSVSHDGSTVTVTDPGISGSDDAESTAVVERVDADPTRPLIAEQVMGLYGPLVRNTLSVLDDGVETVRYHREDSIQTMSFGDLRGEVVRFEGATVEFSIKDSRRVAL